MLSDFAVVPSSRDNLSEETPNGHEDGREEILRPSTSHLRELVRKRDFYAGGLMLLLGVGIALKGATYRAGTLMHMGPGFLPTALGIILVLLGIAIAAAAYTPHETLNPEAERILPEHPQWWAWFCILMGPVLFIFLGRYFGMAPGTFACVFFSSLGDKDATWKGSFILAAVVTLFGVTLFSYFLQVPMPIFTWRGGL
jgi:Tripartite tricarboxylate transporter TctB family